MVLIDRLICRYKMSWHEASARVPLMISFPKRFNPRTVTQNVSNLDILPTLVDLVDGFVDTRLPLDGNSLLPYLNGAEGEDTVFGEYAGEGTVAPLMMIRRGAWKYVTCPVDPPQLFNLEHDPKELKNLAASTDSGIKKVFHAFVTEANVRWDFDGIHKEVLKSQRTRRVCWQALTRGRFESWDYQPHEDSQNR